MKEFLTFLMPTHVEQGFLTLGGSIGAVVSFLYGGDAKQVLTWLLIFILVDYASGTIAAIKLHSWSSKYGCWGIAKKCLILGLVAMCHGIDTLNPASEAISLRDICAFAFSANEFGSILENIDRCGWGDMIPAPVRKAFASMRDKDFSEKKDAGKKEAE